MDDRPVRVRIGPSPTGEPHVGTAYIALFNLAFAKKNGGKFVLRVEDTDQERSKPEWEAQIMEGLRWLDLDWDEGPDKGGPFGPYRQSERKPIYVEHAHRLLEAGHAYKCFATPEELAAKRAEIKAAKGNYSDASRLHRELTAAEVAAFEAEGRPHVIRMKAPLEGTVVVQDRLRGDVEIAATEVDDQILLKSDGFPTYHLANVVDDHLMGITHVIRAEEWISSTPKHVLLYEMFGWDKPTFVHMPLLRNKDKSKISKRKNPVSIMDYRGRGFLPEAVLNYLASLGFTMPEEQEVFGVEDFMAAFDFDRVQLGGPVFDLDKLTWLNGKYLREKLDAEQLVEHFQTQLFSRERLARIAPLFQERVDVAEQLVEQASYFFVGDVPLEAATLLPKKQTFKVMAGAIDKFASAVDAQLDFGPEALEAMSRAFCEAEGIKVKDLFSTLRVALTGRTASPPLFDVMSVLDRAMVRRRLRSALAVLKKAAQEEAKAAAAAPKADAAAPTAGGAPAKKSKKDKKAAGFGLDTVGRIPADATDALTAAGVATTDALLERAGPATARAELAGTTGLDATALLGWARLADLMRIKGLSGDFAALLVAAGVPDFGALAAQAPEALADKLTAMHASGEYGAKAPNPRAIQMWVERAKVLTPRVEG